MSTLMLAASDLPRAHSAASVQLPKSPEFTNDAERYAWIAEEFHRRAPFRRFSDKGQLARDIAAIAFNITIADLTSKSRRAPLAVRRQKIICVIRLLSHASLPKTGKLVGYSSHSSVAEAFNKLAGEIAPQLGIACKGGAR